jgi:hypothetical protein
MSRLDMNVVPDHTVGLVLNPFQKGGDKSDWRTEDLEAAARSASSDRQAFYSGERTNTHTVTIGQVFKKTHGYFERSPDWNPSFKWKKATVTGISEPTWTRRNGRYRANNNREIAPGCQIGVTSNRGLFLVEWQNVESAEPDAVNIDCTIPEEAMRRTLAGLEAGGYRYLT